MKKFLLCIFMSIILCAASHAQVPYTLTQNGLLNGATVFTVEFWLKTTNSKASNVYWQRPCLFGNITRGDNSGDFVINTNAGYIGMFEGISSLNSDQQFLSTNVRISDNVFHHIAAVNNGQTISLYVDGKITCVLISGRPLQTQNAPLTFGAASIDYNLDGNTNNTNFGSEPDFGDAAISSIAKYTTNFQPAIHFERDANTVALYHFGSQGNYNNSNMGKVAINMDPNRPVILNDDQAVTKDNAQPATLFINDSTVLYGSLLLAKKNWSFNSVPGIHFFENGSKKDRFIKPEEIKGFKMGDSYYEPKFIGSGPVSTPLTKVMVKRLTPEGSKMNMYQYINHTNTKNGNGTIETKETLVLLVELPHTTDDKVYQLGDNKFSPKFDTKVSAIFADKPALAEKIRSKNKDYFFAFITEQSHQEKVWWNIVREYNGE